MSKSFNINLFKSSVSAFCAQKAERPQAFAAFLADNLSSALESTLIDGSDAINQAFLILKNSGKAGFAVKFRKVVNETDWEPIAQWGQVSELAFIKAGGYIGGNSQKCSDKDQRREAVDLIRENIKVKGLEVFTPAVKDGDVDPLAGFGKFNAEKIDGILAGATVEQLTACLSRLQALEMRVSTALSTITMATETVTIEPATVEPATVAETVEPATVEPATVEPATVAETVTIEPATAVKVRKNRKAA